jgi:hypothetical protein
MAEAFPVCWLVEAEGIPVCWLVEAEGIPVCWLVENIFEDGFMGIFKRAYGRKAKKS